MESGDEPEASNLLRGNKDRCRHSPYQRQQLKAYFKKWDFPDENQRQQLSRELGLSPTQIKCWFQNERSQLKEKNETEALREQHRAIKCQNDALRMAFLTMNCSSCGGPASGDEEWQESFQKLLLENAQLKDQYDKLISLASHYFGKPISEVESLASAASSLLELSHGSSMGNTVADGTEEVGSLETSTSVNSPSG